jgi:hypothetical protein
MHAALGQQAAVGHGTAAVLGGSDHLLPSACCCRPPLQQQQGSRRPRTGGEAGAGGQLQPRVGRGSQQQRRMAVPLAQVAQHSARGRRGGGEPARSRRSQGAIQACKPNPLPQHHCRSQAQPPRRLSSPPSASASASPSSSHCMHTQRRQPSVRRRLQLARSMLRSSPPARLPPQRARACLPGALLPPRRPPARAPTCALHWSCWARAQTR